MPNRSTGNELFFAQFTFHIGIYLQTRYCDSMSVFIFFAARRQQVLREEVNNLVAESRAVRRRATNIATNLKRLQKLEADSKTTAKKMLQLTKRNEKLTKDNVGLKKKADDAENDNKKHKEEIKDLTSEVADLKRKMSDVDELRDKLVRLEGGVPDELTKSAETSCITCTKQVRKLNTCLSCFKKKCVVMAFDRVLEVDAA